MENIKEVRVIIGRILTVFTVVGMMLAVIFISAGSAATYYVDAARPDDSGDGLSWANAWKHIQKAADIVIAGDTVEVRAGIYNEGAKDGGYGTVGSVPAYPYPVADDMYPLKSRVLIDSKNGTAVAPITFHANGEVIVDAASANIDIDACFYVYNSRYIVIDGFTCINARSANLSFNYHYGYGNGILLDMSSYCTIANNICYNNNSNGICLGRVAGNTDASIRWAYSRGSCNYNYIINNICYDNGSPDLVGSWAAGILLFGGGSIIGDDGNYGPYVSSNRNWLMYNYCYQNFSKGMGIIGFGDFNFIRYNILSNNWQLGGHEGAGMVFYKVITQQLFVNNNTIVDHTGGYGDGIFAVDTWDSPPRIFIYDNIIANNSTGMEKINGVFDVVPSAINDFYNTTQTKNCSSGASINYDPLFRTTMGALWANSYLLKAKYKPDKDINGNTIETGDGKTSPCVDRSIIAGLDLGAHQFPGADTVTTSTGTITINEAGGQVGYPDKSGNLNGYADGKWYNTHYAILSFDLSDPVDPSAAEALKYNYQIKYESSDFSAPNYAATDPLNEPNPVSLSTSPVLDYECQYNWRVKCIDRVNGNNLNYSTFTVANNGNIAFGLDWTSPLPVNPINTDIHISSVTLSWTAVADRPAANPPPSPLPPGYSRQSDMASYNVYRSTFDTTGYTSEAWKAQVASLGGFAGDSGVFNTPAGAAGNPQTYDDTGPLNPGMYYYAVCGIDNAGNEAEFPFLTPVNIGLISGGGTLIYISGDNIAFPQSFSGDGNAANTAPCYGDDSAAPPSANSITLAVKTSRDCDLTHYNDSAYQIGNDHWVRHYARITTGTGAHPPEVYFYYTVGTYQTKVFTYVDSNINANYYIKGTPYIPVSGGDPTYTYFYADIPSDIHAAGDNPWNAAQPWGVVGVRVCGHSSYDVNPVWVNEDPSPGGYTYTYYARKSDVNYKSLSHPGERINNVRPYPLKHVSVMANNLLTNDPASTQSYFMPNGNAPVDNKTYTAGKTVNGSDNRPDIFYGEKPDLYIRLAYGDGDIANSYVVSRSSAAGGYDTGWIGDVPLSAPALSGIDNKADDSSVPGGLGSTANQFKGSNYFYGHFSFMKTPDATNLANIGANVPPEGADVMYFFAITDGVITKFRYAGGVTNNAATAQANPYRYYVLQNDYSRPYIQTAAADLGELTPQDVTDSGNCSWMTFYTVKTDLWDRSNGAGSWLPVVYGNVINSRGNDSGVYHNPVDPGVGSAGNSVHDTRVYYKISTTKPTGINADKYLLAAGTAPDFNYIPDNAPAGGTDPDFGVQYTLNGNPCGYVQMTGPRDGGQWVGPIPLKAGNIDSSIYYRLYVCNDDHDPQAYNWPSENIIDGTGAANVGNVDSWASGAALSAPYSLASGDIDRDHGWAMYTRYGGKITGPKMIKIRAKVIIQGITKNVVAYINAEGKTLGNIIYTEIEKNQ